METVTVAVGWQIVKVTGRGEDIVVKETETIDLPKYLSGWIVRLGAGTV